MIITIAVPAAHVADASDLAMALGFSTADEQTYGNPSWQDTAGNLYSAASLVASDGFVSTATSTLQRPEWDAEQYISMAAANRAQDLVVLWVADGDTDAPQANPNAITAISGMVGLDALAAMGLTRVEGEAL
tara:strand:- start:42 stop:437 length:396 start_codon:yes stop_codon:yes gene_type:complete